MKNSESPAARQARHWKKRRQERRRERERRWCSNCEDEEGYSPELISYRGIQRTTGYDPEQVIAYECPQCGDDWLVIAEQIAAGPSTYRLLNEEGPNRRPPFA